MEFRIKSEKELYEECAEIIERSYLVKSDSEDSFSCEDEDECLARELMNKLTPAVLSKLRRSFKKGREQARANDLDKRVEEVMRLAAAEEGIEFESSLSSQDPLWLDEAGFVGALDNIFGNHKYTTHSHKLFALLDPFKTGRVRWRQLIDRLVAVGAKRTATRADMWKPVLERRVVKLEHCKRETIVKLVSVEGKDSFCYVAVSKGGRVGVYTGQLQLIHSYEVFYHRTGVQRRVKTCWITDIIYLPGLQYLILSASDRSLTVYDATTLTHSLVYCITGLPYITTCMSYTHTTPAGCPELVLGSERGDITRIAFLQPRVSLFYNKTSEGTNHYFWMELSSPPHSSYCTVHTWRRVHSRGVRRVVCERDGAIVASCSHDSTASVRLRSGSGALKDYLFNVHRGVSCFHLVPSLHLLVTGSCDGVVRLWESTQSSPFATLTAPGQAAVLDVAVVASKEIVIAYCTNCWLHIWDLYEEYLLQTIKVKFPFLGVLGKKPEFGAYCIHPGPARKYPTEEEDAKDEDVLAPALQSTSRRPSSVILAATGGLVLQPDNAELPAVQSLEDDKEYTRFNRPDILVTCCDYVCIIDLSRDDEGVVLPPPGDTMRPRRPSYWDLPDDVFQEPPITSKPSPSAISPDSSVSSSSFKPQIPSSMLLSPAAAEFDLQDLDTLLENAGLQGILKKDFVMMMGLKYDLNRKLADMKANMQAMTSAVSMGAPYLALRCQEPTPVPPADEMLDEYRRVMKLFPEASLAGTPNTSKSSTPRKKNSTSL